MFSEYCQIISQKAYTSLAVRFVNESAYFPQLSLSPSITILFNLCKFDWWKKIDPGGLGPGKPRHGDQHGAGTQQTSVPAHCFLILHVSSALLHRGCSSSCATWPGPSRSCSHVREPPPAAQPLVGAYPSNCSTCSFPVLGMYGSDCFFVLFLNPLRICPVSPARLQALWPQDRSLHSQDGQVGHII